ncbi:MULTISPECIES: hypothetical protein [Frankia]|uniref:hypothetical protein n=1 Tax=Frankia TaxID=1854 RepID=UPI000AEACB49|nr:MULTISPECIES: hypothetical protein [Frankia]
MTSKDLTTRAGGDRWPIWCSGSIFMPGFPLGRHGGSERLTHTDADGTKTVFTVQTVGGVTTWHAPLLCGVVDELSSRIGID